MTIGIAEQVRRRLLLPGELPEALQDPDVSAELLIQLRGVGDDEHDLAAGRECDSRLGDKLTSWWREVEVPGKSFGVPTAIRQLRPAVIARPCPSDCLRDYSGRARAPGSKGATRRTEP